MNFRLGLDTGGTYTDAVLINEQQEVVATAKSLTSHDDLLQGLEEATDKVLAGHDAPVTLVSLSTTLATNALVEGRGRPVALVLIGFNESQLERAGLRQALGDDPYVLIAGGHSADGTPLCALDVDALGAFVATVQDRVEAFAVSSLFAVRNPAHEQDASLLIEQLSGKPVSSGHGLSASLDAPRRALTALLNARLIPMLGALIRAAGELLARRHIEAPLMVVKADGSLIRAADASLRPVETILSGPAASVIGARFLCRHDRGTDGNLLVADMGGTTTDIALLQDGEPRLSADGATVGGWRTMVRAVDIRTYGLGGDSHVQLRSATGSFDLGPARVLPLCCLATQFTWVVNALQEQVDAEVLNEHAGQFVLPVGLASEPDGQSGGITLAHRLASLTRQQRSLYERIAEGPVAVQSLFASQSLTTALSRLIQRGDVRLSAFTPTDACHVMGIQSRWNTQAACLGALLLHRRAGLGRARLPEASASSGAKATAQATEPAPGQAAEQVAGQVAGQATEQAMALATAVIDAVSERAARVLLDSVLSGDHVGSVFGASGPTADQDALLDTLFRAGRHPSLVGLQVNLGLPVVAIGAPAISYFGAAAERLATRSMVPEHADVANAIGAVVGVVRQQVELLMTPLDAEGVRVHYPTGPVDYPELATASCTAEAWLRSEAVERAKNQGTTEAYVTVERFEKSVEEAGRTLFIECRLVVTAVGRPDCAIHA